eukprot:TRINITY_DN12052_c0_g1_i1.p1 TRINITY_DN12052_c0_g1~~TRINITY_DN12052_c0_g1_i1.p1  ORF type:complete len:135 (-),score=30.92 TRINITY_DN12052_c0_g1_i1:316-720(-)
MLRSLVGSEMCIRDRWWPGHQMYSYVLPQQLELRSLQDGWLCTACGSENMSVAACTAGSCSKPRPLPTSYGARQAGTDAGILPLPYNSVALCAEETCDGLLALFARCDKRAQKSQLSRSKSVEASEELVVHTDP